MRSRLLPRTRLNRATLKLERSSRFRIFCVRSKAVVLLSDLNADV